MYTSNIKKKHIYIYICIFIKCMYISIYNTTLGDSPPHFRSGPPVSSNCFPPGAKLQPRLPHDEAIASPPNQLPPIEQHKKKITGWHSMKYWLLRVPGSHPKGIYHHFPSNLLSVMVEFRYPNPETNSKLAPENGWLEYDCLSFWDCLLSGAMLVSGRVTSSKVGPGSPKIK